MKILAIRGKNLASLAGEFEIDFQRQPLASAGLFAISGPTGAGKSTLLDALCLALYDQTPRLIHAVSAGVKLRDVGEETLSPQDARNLLRRGCTEAYAEVEFIGNDQGHYRSRWSVRRARGSATGKLQASEMKLHRLPDGQAIGGLKSEVQQEIRQRLGLNFAQFTRAVLLAQNEFSVFLKAPDGERAELLETLTGTEEYSRISVRAYERFKAEKDALDRLKDQLAGQQPLEKSQREALEQEKQALDGQLNAKAQEKNVLETRLQWHQSFAALQAAENQALEALGQAQAGHGQAQAQARRAHLDLVESLQDARPLLSELDRLTTEQQHSQAKLEQAEKSLAEAQHGAQNAQALEQQAKAALAQAEQQKQAAAADIITARALDAEINTLSPNHSQRHTQLDAATQALALNEAELVQKQQASAQAQSQCANARDWLADHTGLEALSTQWPRWEALFKQAKHTLGQMDAGNSQLSSAQQAFSQAQTDLQNAQKQADELALQFAEAEQAYQSAVNTAAGFNAEALMDANRIHQLRLEQCRDAATLWQALDSLGTQKTAHTEKLEAIRLDRQQRAALLAATRESLPDLSARDGQAKKMLDLLKLACSKNVESLRASLKPDSECPVCGAKEHPFVTEPHPLREELKTLEQEVLECHGRRTLAEKQESRLTLELEQLAKQQAELENTLDTLGQNFQQQQIRWQNHALVAEWAQVAEADLNCWLPQQTAACEAAQTAVRESLKAMNEANHVRDKAREGLDGLNRQQKTAQQVRETVAQDLQAAQLKRQNLGDKVQGLQNQLAQQLDELDGAFSESAWRADWQQAPDGFYQSCAAQAKDWQAQQLKQERLGKQLEVLAVEISALSAKAEHSRVHLLAAQADFDAFNLQITGKKAARLALFGGQPVSDIEAALEKNLGAAQNRLQAATGTAQSCATEAAARQEARTQVLSQLNRQQSLLAEAAGVLDDWIASFNSQADIPAQLDAVLLRQHLQHDKAWLQGERQALQSLDQALAEAQTVLSERRQQSEQQLKTRTSLDSLEQLQEQMLDLQALVKDLQRQGTELALQLRRDEERKNSAADLLVKIQAQSELFDTWNKLSDLIGSADGKKFRLIAQQRTLDILLGYANQHLKDLSRRYRLERVKNTLALQVVDQDMGGEIRSVHSLSGGESFLLSLALALGLASLSSNRVRVESLFIDEGFGSLDAGTLRVAMDALDSLQALGRKVGVISHVQEMTERIGARIQVNRLSGGLSKVVVEG